MKVTIAKHDGVDSFPEEIAALLLVLGHSEALVTDESWLSDFITFGLSGNEYYAERRRIYKAIEARFGVDVYPEGNLLAICRLIAQNRTRQ